MMAHGEVNEILPAPSEVVFDVLHDYGRRLEWDTLLRAAYLEGDHKAAGKGVTSVCVGRRSLGGIALRTVYVSFQRPTLAAVKMINRPAFFQTWAIPNVFFHVTTAYALMRHNGVELGKKDLLHAGRG